MIAQEALPPTYRKETAIELIKTIREETRMNINTVMRGTNAHSLQDTARTLVMVDVYDKILDYLDILEGVYATK